AGVPVVLSGLGTDPDDPDISLTYHWQVDIHHNNHVHPGTFVSDKPLDFMYPENHDDGTGVYLEVILQVSDPGGLTGEQREDLFPEIDLTPDGLSSTPATPRTDSAATYGF